VSAAAPGSAPARVITVGGGRGGVGKSLLAAELGWALAQSGRRVVLVDLDLCAPSQHHYLGVPGSRPGLTALLSGGEAFSATPHPNLWLVAGGSPAGGTPLVLSAWSRLRLLERLCAMPADVVVVDVGAGTGYDAVDLLELGHHRLIVTSCQPASVQDAFGLLKGATLRLLQRELGNAGQLALLEPAVRKREGERVSDILRRVRSIDPVLAAQLGRTLAGFAAALFASQVPDATQLGALQAMSNMALEYLGVSVPLVGWMRAGARLPELTLARGGPFGPPASDEARLVRGIAEALLCGPEHNLGALLAELHAAARLGSQRGAPPPLPAVVHAPPAPAAAPLVKPRVYVRPPRKRRPGDTTPLPIGVRSAADDPERPRTATLPGLPGMPPRRTGH
jgi:flagellar biosynthesis protein FlhG